MPDSPGSRASSWGTESVDERSTLLSGECAAILRRRISACTGAVSERLRYTGQRVAQGATVGANGALIVLSHMAHAGKIGLKAAKGFTHVTADAFEAAMVVAGSVLTAYAASNAEYDMAAIYGSAPFIAAGVLVATRDLHNALSTGLAVDATVEALGLLTTILTKKSFSEHVTKYSNMLVDMAEVVPEELGAEIAFAIVFISAWTAIGVKEIKNWRQALHESIARENEQRSQQGDAIISPDRVEIVVEGVLNPGSSLCSRLSDGDSPPRSPSGAASPAASPRR